MADLGTTYGFSGKSTIEKSSGENSSLEKVTSEITENKYIIDDNVFNTISLDSVDSAIGSVVPDTVTNYFVMRGRDVDCVGIVYRFWTVTSNPDTTGASYIGAKCGVSPLADIIVAFKYVQ